MFIMFLPVSRGRETSRRQAGVVNFLLPISPKNTFKYCDKKTGSLFKNEPVDVIGSFIEQFSEHPRSLSLCIFRGGNRATRFPDRSGSRLSPRLWPQGV